MVFKPFGLHPAPLYWITAGTAVLLLVLTGFMLQVAVRGSRLEYRLEDHGLVIVWGRGIAVPYGDIEAVHRMEGRPRVRRQVGTAVGGLNVGRFHVEGVGSVRLYGGRVRDHLVIVDAGSRGRFALTPDDPDRFVAELTARLPRPR